MRSTEQELRTFALKRFQIASELTVCTLAFLLLLVLAPEVDRVGPEPQVVFLASFLLLGTALLRLMPRLIPILLFRCPRCARHFHAASQGPRPAVSVRSCAHCGVAVPPPSSSTA